MIGKVLSNRYKLTAELGSGGMAWVYLAEDLREGRQVAVKVLYPQLSQDVGFLQRFTQEAKLAMSLSQSAPDRHVAGTLDYGSDRDTHYLVMEYVEGRDLRTLLDEEGPLPWQEALEIAQQVTLALGHAHQHGVVHRDIKPENIMLLPDGTVRVLDFGVARAPTSPTLTQSGFVGSPSYAAPEQAMGRAVDIRADLYSLGTVLYEMLAAELPFQSDTPWAIISHHIATPPPLLEEVRPDLPRSVSHLVRKTMSKRPEDRFQTPARMVQAIDAVLSGMDLPFELPVAEPEALAPLLAGLYQRALEAVEDQEWPEAVNLFSQILKLDPRYRDVTEQLAEAGRQARLAALYSAARRALKDGHWAEALGQLHEITEVAPNYLDVENLRASTRHKYVLDQLYRQGVEHLEAKDWAAAVQCLEQVHTLDPRYGRTSEFLETARAESEAAGEQAPPPATGSPPYRPPEPARRRNWLWAVVAFLVLALAVETFFFYRSQQPPAGVGESALPAATAAAVTLQPTEYVSPTTVPTAAPPQPSSTLPLTDIPAPIPRTPEPAHSSTPTPTPRLTSGSTALPASAMPSPTPTATPTPSLTPSPTHTRTLSATVTPPSATSPTPEPSLAGQIAFPRFDPIRGTYDVYACLVDGSGCQRVAAEASQPDFLPDGTRLVVHSWKPDDKGLLLQTLSGQRIWDITRSLEAARPSVDFQGKVYVYHSRQEGDREPRIYRTYDADTGSIMRNGGAVLGQSPVWLPDGRILYSGCVGDACGIVAMRSDGSDSRQVVAGSTEVNPEASPDGRQVAFMSQRDGDWEVYLVNVDGSGLRPLTRNPANDGLPAWSPDGQHIAFVSDRDGSWAVWAMNPDGSDQRRLFALGGPLDGLVRDAAPHETQGWVEERISWSPSP